jgi:type IV pilus assembly protein PilA
MRKLHTRKGGFTLIELMIVVAIIGILAAIAIPNFLMFQLRSKTGEAKTNLAAIRTAEEGYFAEFGTYVDSAGTFGGNNTPQKQVWPTTASGGFMQLGWAPEGDVFFQYAVTSNAAPPATPGTNYTADAQADLDGDGNQSDFGYVHPIPGGAAIASFHGACLTTGTWDASRLSATLLNAVGPCDGPDGQSQF